MFKNFLRFINLRAHYMRKISRTPWFELISMGIDHDGFVKVEMDWNNAFIKQLRENGYDGYDEQDVIQKYIITLLQNVTPPPLTEQEPSIDQSVSEFTSTRKNSVFIK